MTRELAKRFVVTGVDISAEQIRRARQNVRHAEFFHSDILALDFPAASFEAVTALEVLYHLPRGEHERLFRAIARWLARAAICSLRWRATPNQAVSSRISSACRCSGVTTDWTNTASCCGKPASRFSNSMTRKFPTPWLFANTRRMPDQKHYRYFDLILAAFVTVLVVSNVASSAKIIDLGVRLFGVPLAFDAGTILFLFPTSSAIF